MRKILLIVVIFIISCSKQDIIFQVHNYGTTVAQIQIIDFLDTDTKVKIDQNFSTSFDESDFIGIIPHNSSLPDSQYNPQLKLQYSSSSSTSQSVKFSNNTGWNFSSDDNYVYLCYYPFSSSAKHDCISVDYSAQFQKQNGDFSHLSDNDYLCSQPVSPESKSSATFKLCHLGAIANLQLSIPQEYNECRFSRISLESTDRIFVPKYSYGISDIINTGTPQISDEYYMRRFDMTLNNIQSTDGILDLYMMMNPADIKDRVIQVKLFSNTYPYTVLSASFTGIDNQEPGQVYHYSLTVEPKEFVPELPAEPQPGNNLNILFFGHSFAMDCLGKLPSIINAAGITNIHIGQMHEGNASLQVHYKHLINDDKYDYHDFAPKSTYYKNTSRTSRSVLEETPWDIVIFQHSLGNEAAGNYDTYQPALNGLIKEVTDICYTKHGKKPYIGWNMFWSYDRSWSFEPAESMYWNIVSATQRMSDDTGIEIIIPTGTVIQSLRHTSLCTHGVYLFQRDFVHLTNGIGCYAVACTVFEYLIKPIYGISVVGNSFMPTTYTYPDDIVTTEKQQVIWRGSVAAVKNPYGLTEIE